VSTADQLPTVPIGLYSGANRYDTDDEHVLTLWVDGVTYDLRAPKDPDPACAGRHCRHDGLCRRTPGPYEPGHLLPNLRELTYCTCPAIWNAIIPPPPCPMHGTFSMPTITYTTASASLEPPDTAAAAGP
jgi:hypothetical protein